jgi:hypothetical protein
VLDVFLALTRLVCALVIIGLGVSACWKSLRPLGPEGKKHLEDRCYLLFLTGAVLLALNLVSWPLLYLLLQSYVSEWPDVMCIYGVTRIGTGSVGASRFLPDLLLTLQLLKPALIFLSGAWFTLYLINRRTETAALLSRILALLVLVGLFSLADAAAETGYLLIPKKEESASLGCCTAVFDDPSHGVWRSPEPVFHIGDNPGLSAAYFGANAAMVLTLVALTVQMRRRQRLPRLLPLVLGALITLPLSLAFLIEVASPILLQLPYHHCPYDLIPKAPETMLAVALFLGGTFCVGWAALAGWAGASRETRPFLHATVATILGAGLFCYLGSVVMMIVELALV